MTEENLTSPWIMFEAGAISRVVEEKARVCPIVFGIAKTDLVGPLASFQAIEFNRAEVRQLLATINKAAKEAALTERTLNEAFNKWWPDLEEKVQAISSAAQPPTEPQRTQRDLLEEAVSNTRTLIRELSGASAQGGLGNSQSIDAAIRANYYGTGQGILGGLTPKSE
jgi:hypothetical protein